jgi:hypothetical protein
VTGPRPLRLVAGPFDGATFLEETPPAALCEPHTNREPADAATREIIGRAGQARCAIYVREQPMPQAGAIAYRHDPWQPGPLDLNCRLKRIPAVHARALVISEAQRAARDADADAAKDAPRRELPGPPQAGPRARPARTSELFGGLGV